MRSSPRPWPARGARVLAIEPQADIFERLSFNIRQNSFPGIKALELAVADRDGDVTLFVDARNKGETSMRLVGTQGPGGAVRVPAKALGTIVAEEGFTRIDALKLDVEGAEDLILEAFFRDVESRAVAAPAHRRGRARPLGHRPARPHRPAGLPCRA